MVVRVDQDRQHITREPIDLVRPQPRLADRLDAARVDDDLRVAAQVRHAVIDADRQGARRRFADPASGQRWSCGGLFARQSGQGGIARRARFHGFDAGQGSRKENRDPIAGHGRCLFRRPDGQGAGHHARRVEREKIRLNAELTGYKIDQAKYEKEQRLSSANAVVFDIENSIETVKALKVHAGFESAVGFSSYIPSIAGGDAASFEKMLETLKSQSFLVSIQKMQGMGALSNAEGEKLQIALASLDVGQSEPQLRTNLNMIEILFKKGLAQAKRIQSTVRPKEEESWNR